MGLSSFSLFFSKNFGTWSEEIAQYNNVLARQAWGPESNPQNSQGESQALVIPGMGRWRWRWKWGQKWLGLCDLLGLHSSILRMLH